MNFRKRKSYNNTFLQLKEDEKDRLLSMCDSGYYDMEVMIYFNELKMMVSDIANKFIADREQL